MSNVKMRPLEFLVSQKKFNRLNYLLALRSGLVLVIRQTSGGTARCENGAAIRQRKSFARR